MKLVKVKYPDLNSKQQENYNYQKIASTLAEYGFSCMWLNDDWQGADFIANHIDGVEFLKVQLKSRLTINKKYIGKNIYVAFRQLDTDKSYLYPHDELMNKILKELPNITLVKSWKNDGGYSWPKLSKKLITVLEDYLI